LRVVHDVDTVTQAKGSTLRPNLIDSASSRGDAMLRRLLHRLTFELGNGRAAHNAARSLHDDRFVHERIDALARRLPPVARRQPDVA
jgi:hypothetical protein